MMSTEHAVIVSARPMLTADRVMTCMDPSASACHVLQAGARLASQLQAIWFAVYVDSSRTPAPRQQADVRDAREANVELAKALGGIVVRIIADCVADGLIAFVQREGITHVVVGQPRHAPQHWRRHDSTVARLQKDVSGLELVAVALEP
jgi:K+-sensing histidine kinase KdpD